jgi:hypothetical protein
MAIFLQVALSFAICSAAALHTSGVALSKDDVFKGQGADAAENAAQPESFD